MTHKTAILVPSLGRAEYAEQAIKNIENATPEPHIQMWCVTGDDYASALRGYGFEQVYEGGLLPQGTLLYFDDSSNNEDEDYRYVTRMNKLARSVVGLGCDTVFFGSDDVIHHGGWLRDALSVMDESGKAVVVVNDLHNAAGTQAVVRTDYLPKAVFDDPSRAFHPGYRHNFADNEMFFTAMMRDEFTRSLTSHVEHLHPFFRAPNARPWDTTYAVATDGWEQDSELWHSRRDQIEAALS